MTELSNKTFQQNLEGISRCFGAGRADIVSRIDDEEFL